MKKFLILITILCSSWLLFSCAHECEGNFTGENCDRCTSGFTGANCDKCAERFTGIDCDQCAENTYGTDCKLYDSVTDQDGNTYKTVIINGQEWMAENYRRETGTYYYPNNDSNNKATYGLLYNWETATSSNFCPSGWRLPTQQEFSDLLTYVEDNRTSSSDFLALIAKSTAWTDYSNQGGNDFGFGGLPAGIYDSGYYIIFGENGFFWSSTEYGSSDAYYLTLGSGLALVYYQYKTDGLSVRCLKD